MNFKFFIFFSEAFTNNVCIYRLLSSVKLLKYHFKGSEIFFNLTKHFTVITVIPFLVRSAAANQIFVI
jgi:hypothetical protein